MLCRTEVSLVISDRRIKHREIDRSAAQKIICLVEHPSAVTAVEELFISKAQQKTIATKTYTNYDTAAEATANAQYITGLATDFRIEYFRLCNAFGKTTGADTNYNGESIIRQESVGLYLADSAALEAVNSANTVEGYDLTINNGVLGLNYYLNLPGVVLADENAKVVFTTPRGEVQEKLVKDVAAETNGTYKFTANVSSVEMAKDITMQIKSGETVYSIYKNGVASDAYTYSVKEYADAVIASDETSESDKTLVTIMLNYGTYAQKYFDYDAQNLPIAEPSVSLITDNDISAVTIAGTAPQGTKAALVLDSDITIVIYDKDGNKIGEKKGINSLQLDTEYTIELTGGTNVKVSVLAIGEKVLESNATSDNYKNLIKALKLFADASKPFAAQ